MLIHVFLTTGLLISGVCGGRIWTLDPNSAANYANQASSQYSCVRVPPTTPATIDMSTAACNGYQCPRCFIYPETATASQTLTIQNCHASTIYPNDKSIAAPFATVAEQAIEYLFVFARTGTLATFTVYDQVSYSTVLRVGGGGNYIRKLYCINGEFFAV